MDYSGLSEDGNFSKMDNIPLTGDHSTGFYIASALVSSIAILAIIVPAVGVIVTIAYKKDLHKYHYWFVANLMVCDILSALSIAPFYIVLSLLKVFKVAKVMVDCNLVFGIFYIPLICSGFMVVNSVIDAALAISFPLQYENIMTKTKAIVMVVIAWLLAASATLPLIANPELDVKVDNLSSCPFTISSLVILPVIRVAVAFAIIGFNIYLYWSAFKTKWKLKALVADAHNRDGGVKDLHSQLKKHKSFARLSVTLLLIIVVDGVLRIIRVALVVIAAHYNFSHSSTYNVVFMIAAWAEYVNHPVAYGLMLREVYQRVCCNK